jgi:DNA topoisomerase VI subunit B
MLLIDSVFAMGTKIRMKKGSSSQGGDGNPVRRSARQAGQPPEDLPPPPPQAPTTDQIMIMFEEKRNQDLMEFLKSMQTIVGQNNGNGVHSKLSDF